MHKKQTMPARYFIISFWWNLLGSISFELLKIVHHILLVYYTSKSFYGFLGSTYALIYCAVRLSDCGTTNTISPYFHNLIKNKNTFNFLAFKLLGIPFIITITIGAFAAWYYYFYTYTHNLSFSKLSGIILFFLVISEAIRALLRQFLHIMFLSKQIILIEQISFISYLTILWGSYFFGFITLTSNTIFIPFLLESLACTISFCLLTCNVYKKLPNDLATKIKIPKNLFKTRFFNWLLRISRELFTSNILTPLFAMRFGLTKAGLFYFVAALVMSIHAVIKAAIGFSGSALLTHTQNASLHEKQKAFSTLVAHFFMLVIPCGLFLSINYNFLFSQATSNQDLKLLTSSFIMYLCITFLDFFSVLYEQLYFAEQQSKSLFFLKLIEFSLVSSVLFFDCFSQSISTTMIALLIVKTICIMMLIIHAHRSWGVSLKTKIPWFIIGITIIISYVTRSILYSFL